ncbi:MAG: hypothetical protein F6K54_22930 [Okeania sp. SIO3B5]|uniref:leucine-rich repeat domain-containing protein n=1 Tax=Okeania sp. SIO3B5 TaxID=2607811 RepID=UPI0014008CA1|nr:leucine-rich repeat domain-containing protein [Okeania sp. SIO3B5]NEO55669.1 hypothetical protein [Okeania sp. SIO3B5]
MQNQIPEHFQEKIQRAKDNKLKELDLSNNTFIFSRDNEKSTEIPTEIWELEQLEVLNLRGNQLTEIPESITKLTNLTELNFNDNQLTEIPESTTKLTKLTKLNLSNNPLKTPPIEIAEKGIEEIREYIRQEKEEGTDYLYEAKLLILGEGGAGKTTLA